MEQPISKVRANLIENNCVHICRHGKTLWNTEGRIQGSLNSPLTDEGKEYAPKLGNYLLKSDINVIYHSPSGRVLETLEHSNIRGIDLIPCHELLEISHGVYEGMKVSEIDPEWYEDRSKNLWDTKWPQGESYKDVSERLHILMDRVEQGPSKNIAFLAHESVNRVLLLMLGYLSWGDFRTFKQPNNLVISLHMNNVDKILLV